MGSTNECRGKKRGWGGSHVQAQPGRGIAANTRAGVNWRGGGTDKEETHALSVEGRRRSPTTAGGGGVVGGEI